MMAEDLNLPASLERLEINPERVECCKADKNPFNLATIATAEPECSLKNLSLRAECPKGHCHCNRKKEKECGGVGVKRIAHFKKPVLRKSRLSGSLLRAPLLRIKDGVPDDTRAKDLQGLTAAPAAPSNSVDQREPPGGRVGGAGSGKRSRSSDGLPLPPPSKPPLPTSASAPPCSVQARIPCDDTTMDELASYFDVLVHIPKKMSLMAEMMYI